jgi:cytochrome P450
MAMDLDQIDLTDLDRFATGFPHAVFSELRRRAPVFWHRPTEHTPQGEGFWVVSRYADVLHVFQDPQGFSSVGGGARTHGGTMIADLAGAGAMLNMMDDPRHRRIRRLVDKGFTPRMIADLEGELRRRASAIVDGALTARSCDFVTDVARELPLQAICMLLGVPQEDRLLVCEWVELGLEHSDRELGETSASSREAAGKIAAYGASLIEERRRRPKDDMLSVVAHATLVGEDPPRLTDEELSLFFLLLFSAGAETTRKAIAGGLKALLEDPPVLARLRADPTLLASAVEEILRWTTPSVYKRRTATRDVLLRGQRIHAGEKVTVWEMSANRDEAVFHEPFRFDVARDPNPHVAFGSGVHFCLGANLARLEIRILFEELFARVGTMALVGEPVWTRDNRLFGLKHLPVRLEPLSRRAPSA